MYEFVVRTDHALRLWVNDNRKAAHRRVGEVRQRDGVQGERVPARRPRVPDPAWSSRRPSRAWTTRRRTRTRPSKPAFVSLNWKRPNRADEVIPARFLTPQKFPEVAVIETPFPPDDRSSAGSAAPPSRRSGTPRPPKPRSRPRRTSSRGLPELAGAQPGANDRGAKLKAFARTFAERAFRRPLTDPRRRCSSTGSSKRRAIRNLR